MKKNIFFLSILAISLQFGCGGNGTTANTKKEESAMPVGTFMSEYSKSKEATKAKYEGKPLTVTGFALTAPLMPNGSDDTGVLGLMEKGGDMTLVLTCFFSQADSAQFKEIYGNQTVIVKGVFDDSISTALKQCKVVEIVD